MLESWKNKSSTLESPGNLFLKKGINPVLVIFHEATHLYCKHDFDVPLHSFSITMFVSKENRKSPLL